MPITDYGLTTPQLMKVSIRAKIVWVRNIQYQCSQCNEIVSEPWEHTALAKPNYFYMVRCPYCNGTSSVHF